MPCFSPIKGYWSQAKTDKRKRTVVFSKADGYSDRIVQIPCGRCLGCRLEYSRQWAMRCVHEAKHWNENCYLTLTYNDENLPLDWSVSKREWQTFAKKLRKHTGPGTRFFMCAEYGDLGRPHYHALIFNYRFSDIKQFKVNQNGDPLYQSPTLDKIWKKGYATIGEVTFESAAYVARYNLKKQYNKKVDDLVVPLEDYFEADHPYLFETPEGRRVYRTPEFTLSSGASGKSLGGIGAPFFYANYKDIYPSDFMIINGRKVKPPRYYDKLYEKMDPEGFRSVQGRRKISQKNSDPDDNYGRRRDVKLRVLDDRISRLKRNLD